MYNLLVLVGDIEDEAVLFVFSEVYLSLFDKVPSAFPGVPVADYSFSFFVLSIVLIFYAVFAEFGIVLLLVEVAVVAALVLPTTAVPIGIP